VITPILSSLARHVFKHPVNVSVTWPVPMRVLSADLSVADPVLCQWPLRVQTQVVVNARVELNTQPQHSADPVHCRQPFRIQT
jgi:hypothetical protein